MADQINLQVLLSELRKTGYHSTAMNNMVETILEGQPVYTFITDWDRLTISSISPLDGQDPIAPLIAANETVRALGYVRVYVQAENLLNEIPHKAAKHQAILDEMSIYVPLDNSMRLATSSTTLRDSLVSILRGLKIPSRSPRAEPPFPTSRFLLNTTASPWPAPPPIQTGLPPSIFHQKSSRNHPTNYPSSRDFP